MKVKVVLKKPESKWHEESIPLRLLMQAFFKCEIVKSKAD